MLQLKGKWRIKRKGTCDNYSSYRFAVCRLVNVTFVFNRIQEIMTVETELRKQSEDAKAEAILEKNRLNEIHEEEKSELIKV